MQNWPVAIITFLIAVCVNCFAKGLTNVLTIVIALVGGYIVAIPFGLVDFQPVLDAAWFGVPNFTLPSFSLDENWWRAVLLIMPAAIVPCLEHIGDVMAVGTTVGKDFTENPGLSRSVFACGVSTTLSGLLGGPSLTIHSENTGVLAVTHLYSPFIVACGAAWMALLAFCPKFSALCGTIPDAVLGGRRHPALRHGHLRRRAHAGGEPCGLLQGAQPGHRQRHPDPRHRRRDAHVRQFLAQQHGVCRHLGHHPALRAAGPQAAKAEQKDEPAA